MKILITLFLFVMSYALVEAADRFAVSSGGVSNTSCTDIAIPCTLARALSQTASGDTLNLKGGVYTSTIDLSLVASGGGSYASATIIQSAPGETATIQTSGATPGIDNNGASPSYIIIRNLNVDGQNLTAGKSNIRLSNNSSGMNHIRFDAVNTYDNAKNDPSGYGVGAGALIEQCDDCEFINGSSHDNGRYKNTYAANSDYAPYGFYWHGMRGLIHNNQIYNNGAYGVHNYTAHGDTIDNMEISGNVFTNNGIKFFDQFSNPRTSSSIIATNGTGYKIFNNVFNGGQTGIEVSLGGCTQAPNCVIYSNTISGMSIDAISLAANASSVLVRNNILVNSGGWHLAYNTTPAASSNNLCFGTGITTNCNITGQNPNFVSSSDFHLTSSSAAAINAGFTLGSPYNVDIANVARPLGAGYDIGAYEYGSAPPPANPQVVLALPLDTGSGETVIDVSGLNNHGSFGPGVSWDNSGKYGKALSFDGTGSITIPNSGSLDLTGAMTLESWVYFSQAPTGFHAIMAKSGTADHAYFLYGASESGYCPVATSSLAGFTNQTNQTVCDVNAPPLNTWIHNAVTYDGTTLSYYRNGTLVSTTITSRSMVSSNGSLLIGASQWPGEGFVGKLDEIRVKNYAAPESEIQNDMNTPLTPAAPGMIIKIAPGTLKLSATNGALKVGQ